MQDLVEFEELLAPPSTRRVTGMPHSFAGQVRSELRQLAGAKVVGAGYSMSDQIGDTAPLISLPSRL